MAPKAVRAWLTIAASLRRGLPGPRRSLVLSRVRGRPGPRLGIESPTLTPDPSGFGEPVLSSLDTGDGNPGWAVGLAIGTREFLAALLEGVVVVVVGSLAM